MADLNFGGRKFGHTAEAIKQLQARVEALERALEHARANMVFMHKDRNCEECEAARKLLEGK